MKALSLFNGISGLHLALDKSGIEVDTLYYAEIDKFANKVTETHYPNDIPLGDVTKWEDWDIDWSEIDLVTAGFPCQAWSIAGKGLGDKDERGMLFWTTLDIISKVMQSNPKAKYILENVKMKKEFEDYITHHTSQALGEVTKTLINSALVSAQNRNRFYWTNFEVSQPKDLGLILLDVIEEPVVSKYDLPEMYVERYEEYSEPKGNRLGTTKLPNTIGQRHECYGVGGKIGALTATMYKQPPQYVCGIKNESAMKNGKAYTLTASQGNCVAWNSCERKQRTMVPVSLSDEEMPNVYNGVLYRKLSPVECERLQNIPDNFTDCISNSQRYKAIGNGWTINVISHILDCAFKDKNSDIELGG